MLSADYDRNNLRSKSKMDMSHRIKKPGSDITALENFKNLSKFRKDDT
jgi:hypothetical protein